MMRKLEKQNETQKETTKDLTRIKIPLWQVEGQSWQHHIFSLAMFGNLILHW
jgi:hypothetical protein